MALGRGECRAGLCALLTAHSVTGSEGRGTARAPGRDLLPLPHCRPAPELSFASQLGFMRLRTVSCWETRLLTLVYFLIKGTRLEALFRFSVLWHLTREIQGSRVTSHNRSFDR